MATDAEIMAVLRNMPSVSALVDEIDYMLEHRHDPPAVRTPAEIRAALDRAYWPFWKRWWWRRTP